MLKLAGDGAATETLLWSVSGARNLSPRSLIQRTYPETLLILQGACSVKVTSALLECSAAVTSKYGGFSQSGNWVASRVRSKESKAELAQTDKSPYNAEP